MEKPEVPAEDQGPTAPAGTASTSPVPGAVTPRGPHAESTGTDTSGPTGGAEPLVPDEHGEPQPIDLADPAGSRFLSRLVPAAVATAVGVLLVVVLVRRRRA